MEAQLRAFGCRIPRTYFVTSGAGQITQDAGSDHFETGSYDLALLEAGIENFNVVKYTSVMPPEAREIDIAKAREEHLFHHGAVLECIMAQMNGEQGQHICAGVGRCKVDIEGVFIGGFAAEYEGNASPEKAKKILLNDLKGIVKRRYGNNASMYDVEYEVRDLIVDEEYGTVLAAICFVDYLFPIHLV